MRNKLTLFFTLMPFALFAQKTDGRKAIIQGVVTGPSKGTIILSKPFAQVGDHDTIDYDHNKFYFEKEIKGNQVFNISTAEDRDDGSWQSYELMLGEGEIVNLDLNVQSIRLGTRIQGGKNQQEFAAFQRTYQDKIASHTAFMDQVRKSRRSKAEIDSINKVNWDKVNLWMLNYGTSNITPTGAYAIWYLVRRYEEWGGYVPIPALIKLNSQYTKSLPHSIYTSAISRYLDGISFNQVNTDFVDISLPDQSGSLSSVSELGKGKLVLLDFWASWCGPCRKKSKLLLPIYDQYRSKNFEIISISVDASKTNWLKAISADKINWITLLDQGNKNYVQDLYHAYTLPANLLVSPEGKILAKNIEPDQLKELLNSRLN
ncbi:MAG TPA: TlpA disulfide reductase family protein [Sphingobacteriaceae bacterium]